MITAKKIQTLVELFEADPDLTSMGAQTGFGFLMDESVPKFQRIEKGRHTPKIVHPMYLSLDHWGGKSLRVYFSLKLTPLTVAQSELGGKSGFEYWVPSAGAAIVVKRYLDASDYQDEVTLAAAVEEMLKECARIYLTACREWS